MHALLSVVDSGGEFYVKIPKDNLLYYEVSLYEGSIITLLSKSTPKYWWFSTTCRGNLYIAYDYFLIFMTCNIFADQLWPCNSPTLIKIFFYYTHYSEYKYSVPLLRNDLLCDRVQFVPTCPIFASPVTYTL